MSRSISILPALAILLSCHSTILRAESAAGADVSGKYVRKDGAAELLVQTLPGAKVHIMGSAVWHDHTGELDFTATISNGVVKYADGAYRLQLEFRKNHLRVDEQNAMGYHGMNVTFEGEYGAVPVAGQPAARIALNPTDPCLRSIPEYVGSRPDGRRLSKKDWDRMLSVLDEWRDKGGEQPIDSSWREIAHGEPAQDQFIGLRLRDVRLSCGPGQFLHPRLAMANLERADLSGSKMSHSELDFANLRSARLKNTDLFQASAEGANFSEADLTGVNLADGNLAGAIFDKAVLVKANLASANLTRSSIRDADMTDADLNGANLDGAVFEPSAAKLPPVRLIAFAGNLSGLTFDNTPQALVALRVAFRESGHREQERAVTYAIERRNRERSCAAGITGYPECAFRYALFEVTSDYGMSAGRPLLIMVVLIPVFALAYLVLSLFDAGSAIWRVWDKDSVASGNGTKARQSEKVSGRDGFHIYILYFSLLSAVRIGWREINAGQWLYSMQQRDYTLHATGRIRSLSGLQSVISVYLLALAVLSYFGRPFG